MKMATLCWVKSSYSRVDFLPVCHIFSSAEVTKRSFKHIAEVVLHETPNKPIRHISRGTFEILPNTIQIAQQSITTKVFEGSKTTCSACNES